MARSATRRRRSSVPVIPIVFVVVVILLIAAFLLSTRPSGEAIAAAFGEVTIEGDPLPRHEGDPSSDPAIGSQAPAFSGADHDGEPLEVTWDGTPRVLLFLAHWCPACQAEVPWVQDFEDSGDIPEEVEVVSVTTWTDEQRELFPPQQWLEDEGWTLPNISDDEDFSLANAYGMSSSPYWVFVDGDGEVWVRIPGGVPQENFLDLIDEFLADVEE